MRKMDANEESDASNHEENNREERSKSVVWDHFRVNQDGKNICLLCERAVKASDGNNSNLFSHLRTRHPKKYKSAAKAKKQQQDRKKKQSNSAPSTSAAGIKQSFIRMEKYDKKSKRWKQISDAITVYLAKDMVPIYTVEKSGFKQLVGTLDKQYELPSRKYFTKTAIPTLQEMQ